MSVGLNFRPRSSRLRSGRYQTAKAVLRAANRHQRLLDDQDRRDSATGSIKVLLGSASIGGSMAATVDGAECEPAGADRAELRYSSRKPTLSVTW